MKIVEKYAIEILQQVQNGASVSDVMQLLQDFEKQEWVSVDYKLPENQDLVLVKTNLNSVCTAYLHGLKSGFITYGEDAFVEFGEITHWRLIEISE